MIIRLYICDVCLKESKSCQGWWAVSTHQSGIITERLTDQRNSKHACSVECATNQHISFMEEMAAGEVVGKLTGETSNPSRAEILQTLLRLKVPVQLHVKVINAIDSGKSWDTLKDLITYHNPAEIRRMLDEWTQ